MLISFISSLITVPAGAQILPMTVAPAGFQPPMLLGLRLHPENPLLFDFIVDQGQAKLSQEELKTETEKLVKYFLAALTIPDKEVWVNLSPTEKDRIIPEVLGQTVMGKTMLEQDYTLKQLASSLTNPETDLGKKYWQKAGVTPTLSKVWIVPDKAEVLERDGIVLVGEKRLSVRMDEDTDNAGIFKTMLLPVIDRKINESKDFADVRQIYNSVILATWYKQALKETLLGKVYADKNKVVGVETNDKEMKQRIYERYLEAFKKGAYNLIKEETDPVTGEMIPRKYFSGGITSLAPSLTIRAASPVQMQRALSASSSVSVVTVQQATAEKERLVLESRLRKGDVAAASSGVDEKLFSHREAVLNDREAFAQIADEIIRKLNTKGLNVPANSRHVLGFVLETAANSLQKNQPWSEPAAKGIGEDLRTIAAPYSDIQDYAYDGTVDADTVDFLNALGFRLSKDQDTWTLTADAHEAISQVTGRISTALEILNEQNAEENEFVNQEVDNILRSLLSYLPREEIQHRTFHDWIDHVNDDGLEIGIDAMFGYEYFPFRIDEVLKDTLQKVRERFGRKTFLIFLDILDRLMAADDAMIKKNASYPLSQPLEGIAQQLTDAIKTHGLENEFVRFNNSLMERFENGDPDEPFLDRIFGVPHGTRVPEGLGGLFHEKEERELRELEIFEKFIIPGTNLNAALQTALLAAYRSLRTERPSDEYDLRRILKRTERILGLEGAAASSGVKGRPDDFTPDAKTKITELKAAVERDEVSKGVPKNQRISPYINTDDLYTFMILGMSRMNIDGPMLLIENEDIRGLSPQQVKAGIYVAVTLWGFTKNKAESKNGEIVWSYNLNGPNAAGQPRWATFRDFMDKMYSRKVFIEPSPIPAKWKRASDMAPEERAAKQAEARAKVADLKVTIKKEDQGLPAAQRVNLEIDSLRSFVTKIIRNNAGVPILIIEDEFKRYYDSTFGPKDVQAGIRAAVSLWGFAKNETESRQRGVDVWSLNLSEDPRKPDWANGVQFLKILESEGYDFIIASSGVQEGLGRDRRDFLKTAVGVAGGALLGEAAAQTETVRLITEGPFESKAVSRVFYALKDGPFDLTGAKVLRLTFPTEQEGVKFLVRLLPRFASVEQDLYLNRKIYTVPQSGVVDIPLSDFPNGSFDNIRQISIHSGERAWNFYLGQDKAKQAVPQRIETVSSPVASSSSVVLVVDDDLQIRQKFAEALNQSGYTVLQASNVADAISIVESLGGRINLITADGQMPLSAGEGLEPEDAGRAGLVLATKLQEKFSKIPLVLISGDYYLREEAEKTRAQFPNLKGILGKGQVEASMDLLKTEVGRLAVEQPEGLIGQDVIRLRNGHAAVLAAKASAIFKHIVSVWQAQHSPDEVAALREYAGFFSEFDYSNSTFRKAFTNSYGWMESRVDQFYAAAKIFKKDFPGYTISDADVAAILHASFKRNDKGEIVLIDPVAESDGGKGEKYQESRLLSALLGETPPHFADRIINSLLLELITRKEKELGVKFSEAEQKWVDDLGARIVEDLLKVIVVDIFNNPNDMNGDQQKIETYGDGVIRDVIDDQNRWRTVWVQEQNRINQYPAEFQENLRKFFDAIGLTGAEKIDQTLKEKLTKRLIEERVQGNLQAIFRTTASSGVDDGDKAIMSNAIDQLLKTFLGQDAVKNFPDEGRTFIAFLFIRQNLSPVEWYDQEISADGRSSRYFLQLSVEFPKNAFIAERELFHQLGITPILDEDNQVRIELTKKFIDTIEIIGGQVARAFSAADSEGKSSSAVQPLDMVASSGVTHDPRPAIIEKLREVLPADFTLYPGGFASIDIMPKVDKNSAMHAIFDQDPQLEAVYYFGNEFYATDKKVGNDTPVLRARSEINKQITIISLDEKAEERTEDAQKHTTWLGVGPLAGVGALEAIATALENGESTVTLRGAGQDSSKEIAIDLVQLREKGAMYFDVDGTILDKKADNFENQEGIRTVFSRLLTQGIRLGIISGNSRVEQSKRIVAPLAKQLTRPADITKLTLYVNGGATKVEFNQAADSLITNLVNPISPEVFGKIQSVINQMAGTNFGLEADEVSAWHAWANYDGQFGTRQDFPNIKFNMSWTSPDFSVAVIDSEVISAAKLSPTALETTLPFIENRDGMQISIKPLPKQLDMVASSGVNGQLAEKLAGVIGDLGPEAASEFQQFYQRFFSSGLFREDARTIQSILIENLQRSSRIGMALYAAFGDVARNDQDNAVMNFSQVLEITNDMLKSTAPLNPGTILYGHSHGDTHRLADFEQTVAQLAAAVGQGRLSRGEYVKLMTQVTGQFFAQNSKLIESQRKDIDYIRAKIAAGVKRIGFEYSDLEWQELQNAKKENLINTAHMIGDEIKAIAIPGAEQMADDLVLYFLGPIAYMFMSDDPTLKGVEIVALDSEELKANNELLRDKVIAADQRLQSTLRPNQVVYEFMMKTIRAILDRPAGQNSPTKTEIKQMEDFLSSRNFAKAVPQLQKYWKAVEAHLEGLTTKRDEVFTTRIAQNVKEFGPMLIILGKAHTPALEKRLTDADVTLSEVQINETVSSAIVSVNKQNEASEMTKGGINSDTTNMNLQTKRDGVQNSIEPLLKQLDMVASSGVNPQDVETLISLVREKGLHAAFSNFAEQVILQMRRMADGQISEQQLLAILEGEPTFGPSFKNFYQQILAKNKKSPKTEFVELLTSVIRLVTIALIDQVAEIAVDFAASFKTREQAKAFDDFLKVFLLRNYHLMSSDQFYKALGNQDPLISDILQANYRKISEIFPDAGLDRFYRVAIAVSQINRSAPLQTASAPTLTPVGGIDFDPTNMNLQIKRDGLGVPLPLPQQNLEQINIEGLFPVIINIVPINAQNLPLFLGQAPTEPAKEAELTSAASS